MSTWQDAYTAMARTKKRAVTLVARTKRRPVQAIGFNVTVKSTLLKNKSGVCGTSGHSQTISLKSMNASMINVGGMTVMTRSIIGLTSTT
jgi:hypothetical protein